MKTTPLVYNNFIFQCKIYISISIDETLTRIRKRERCWFTRYLTIEIGYKYLDFITCTSDNNGNRYLECTPSGGKRKGGKFDRESRKNVGTKVKERNTCKFHPDGMAGLLARHGSIISDSGVAPAAEWGRPVRPTGSSSMVYV